MTEHPLKTIKKLINTAENAEYNSEERINHLMSIYDKVLDYGNDTKYKENYLKKATINLFEIAYEKVKEFSKSHSGFEKYILQFENLIHTAKDFAKENERVKQRRLKRELALLEWTLNA